MKELMIIFFISLMFIHSVSAIGEIYSENEIFIIGEGICQINLKFIINDDYQGFPDSRIYLRKGDTGEDFSVSYSTTVMGYWHVYPESFLSGWELIYNESTNTLALEETADCDVDACIDSDNGALVKPL